MEQEVLLGIDIGTQSSRTALLDLDGKLIASASQSSELQSPRPGWAQQDPQMWWDQTVVNLHDVFAQSAISPHAILGIGVSGQMHGTVPIGQHGELLSHGVQLWCDKRNADIVEQFKARPEAEGANLIAGTPPAASWFGFKIKWVQQNEPDVYKRTCKFVVPKDWINYKLSGALAIDYSEASGSFLMDAKTLKWSDDLIQRVGVDRAKLPEIFPSSGVIGRVTKDAARETGLVEGTPVVAGGGDMLLALLAAGINQPGRACDITGSSGIFSVYSEQPVNDGRLMNLHHAMPGWIPFGIIDSGGVSLKWFKDAFCQTEIEIGKKTGRSPYAILDDYAREVDAGAEGLLFFPYLFGERTLGSAYARGVFFGTTARTGKGAMARAIMEGVNFELKRPMELALAAGAHVTEVRATAGGAQSPLWLQIKADIYQRPILTFESFEGSILGAAIVAGVGAGVYPSEREGAERVIRLGPVYQPSPAHKERYDYLFEMFKDLHERFQQPYNRYSKLP